MRLLIVTLILIIGTSSLCFGQITGNLNVKDPKAIELTDEIVKLLCAKGWDFIKLIENIRGTETEYKNQNSASKPTFDCNGEFWDDFRGRGKWKKINNQYLQVTITIESNNYLKSKLKGAWAIYEISDSTLVLTKVLTSSGDWKKQYYFKRAK
jgi:hypothetical protein